MWLAEAVGFPRIRLRRPKKTQIAAAPTQESLHIKGLIRQVTQELVDSQKEREENKQPALFRVQQLTLEVHFVAQTSSEVGGSFDLKVVTVGGAQLGGKHTYQNQQIHKITLTLSTIAKTPADESDGNVPGEFPGPITGEFPELTF